jgi:hypothetical protein
MGRHTGHCRDRSAAEEARRGGQPTARNHSQVRSSPPGRRPMANLAWPARARPASRVRPGRAAGAPRPRSAPSLRHHPSRSSKDVRPGAKAERHPFNNPARRVAAELARPRCPQVKSRPGFVTMDRRRRPVPRGRQEDWITAAYAEVDSARTEDVEVVEPRLDHAARPNASTNCPARLGAAYDQERSTVSTLGGGRVATTELELLHTIRRTRHPGRPAGGAAVALTLWR